MGLDFKHETYQTLPTHSTAVADTIDASRNIWGLYGQWDQKINDKNEFILSARETWTTSATKGQNYNNFSGAGQFIHKLDENQSLYVSIAQSFIMPHFNQMYKTGYQQLPNPNLKPQHGLNYEIGWKNKLELITGKLQHTILILKITLLLHGIKRQLNGHIPMKILKIGV